MTAKKMSGGVGESLRARLTKKLHGAQFRSLNEELYRHSGEANLARFAAEPWLAEAYHRGYREQTARWPVNPLDEMIAWLSRQRSGLVVADFGCGEARLAAEVGEMHEVHSFDLVATRQGVVACNMAHTPLADQSVDVAVFCLALMGPSFLDFLLEARRVLRPRGHLKIAEVRSRFDENKGGIQAFVETLEAIGFDLKSPVDASNSHFLAFHLARSPKSRHHPDLRRVRDLAFDFKVCAYKRR